MAILIDLITALSCCVIDTSPPSSAQLCTHPKSTLFTSSHHIHPQSCLSVRRSAAPHTMSSLPQVSYTAATAHPQRCNLLTTTNLLFSTTPSW
jgi:hypothetical protein